MAKKVRRKNLHRFLVKVTGNQKIAIPCRVRDAKKSVVLTRTFADVLAGTEGLAVTCANAMCAMRINGAAFPHPVYMAEFTDRRAYFVDKLNKYDQPISCVRYEHNQGDFQKAFDTKGKGRLAKMSGVEAEFVLSPPAARGDGTSRKGSTTSGTPVSVREGRRKAYPKGAVARALRAGLNLNIKASAA